MKRSTRMMLMSGGSKGRDGDSRSGDRRGYDRANDNYGGVRDSYSGYAEDKFRDRRGREHYDNGRFAPMRGAYDGGAYDGGAYDAYDSYGPSMHTYPYPMTPYVPPIYQERGGQSGSRRSSGPMNKIGFSLTGEADHIPEEFGQEYRSVLDHQRMNELAYRKGGERMAGYSMGNGYIPFTREIAEEWTRHMENEDGTKGPHWSMEQTKQVQAQRGIECDPLEFWVAMNMIYSDYCKAAKKANANTIDFYADMAKAFLDDQDAPKDKLARYYVYIADAKE